MALGLSLTTRQLLSALDDVALASPTYAQRLNDTPERRLNISADAAARRPYFSSPPTPRADGQSPPPDVPQDWTALPVDGSHIDVDRYLPLRCPPHQPEHSAAQSLKLLRIPCGTHPMLFSRHSWLIVLSVSALRL